MIPDMISNNTQQQWEHLCFLFRMDDEIGFEYAWSAQESGVDSEETRRLRKLGLDFLDFIRKQSSLYGYGL